MSVPDSVHPGAAPGGRDDALAPDPSFWGDEGRGARRHRTRRTGLGAPTGAFGARGDHRVVLAIAGVLAVTAALVSLRAGSPPAPTPAASAAGTASTVPGGPMVVVHVAGAVTRPGVVQLPARDRVVDALDAAGGALTNADLDRLNLAAHLRDGEQVLVPTSVPSATTTTSTTTSTTVPVPTTVAPG